MRIQLGAACMAAILVLASSAEAGRRNKRFRPPQAPGLRPLPLLVETVQVAAAVATAPVKAIANAAAGDNCGCGPKCACAGATTFAWRDVPTSGCTIAADGSIVCGRPATAARVEPSTQPVSWPGYDPPAYDCAGPAKAGLFQRSWSFGRKPRGSRCGN